MARNESNPFDSDVDLPLAQPVQPKRSTIKGKAKPKTTKTKQPKKNSALFGSDSEGEQEPPTPSTSASAPNRKRKLFTFPDSDDEESIEVPIPVAKLKSYLTRRVASGVSQQIDNTRDGEYYVEVRISNYKELEPLPADTRWKHSLISFKTGLHTNSPVWKTVTTLVSAVKQDFASVHPILYPHEK